MAGGIGQPRSAVKKIVEELIAAGLVRCYQNAFYLDRAGLIRGGQAGIECLTMTVSTGACGDT